MKAPSISNVSRETMIDNIKDEYSTSEDFENPANSDVVEQKKDVFSFPFGVDSKKNRLDMLLSDVSSGIKNTSSKNDDKKESDKKKVNGSLFRSFLSFLLKIKELLLLLVILVLLLLGTRKSSNKKK